MKKVLLVLLLALIVFVAVYRQRIFLWDPIAHVTRDGAAVEGARAMINYSNDVLLLDKSAGKSRVYLLQGWDKAAVAPAVLKCVSNVACMTDADQASGALIVVGGRGGRAPFAGVTMTNRRVEFLDEDGGLVEVVLR